MLVSHSELFAKGKLFFALTYHIKNRVMKAQNKETAFYLETVTKHISLPSPASPTQFE